MPENGPQKPRTVDYLDSTHEQVRSEKHTGPIEPSDEWQTIPNHPGVRFRPWRYKNMPKEQMDGAEILIEPGYRTPVQHVVSKHTFNEIRQSGRLIFLAVDPDGNLSRYVLDNDDAGSYMFVMEKGWTMCWIASKNQQKSAEVLEFEEPGFSSAELVTIKDGATEINGHPIPSEFWHAIKVLSPDYNAFTPAYYDHLKSQGWAEDEIIRLKSINQELLEYGAGISLTGHLQQRIINLVSTLIRLKEMDRPVTPDQYARAKTGLLKVRDAFGWFTEDGKCSKAQIAEFLNKAEALEWNDTNLRQLQAEFNELHRSVS